MSLVMAFLNGTDVPDLLRMRTLVTKFIGSVFSCAANLTLGTEGPLVHMGACIASVIALMECGKSSCTASCCIAVSIDPSSMVRHHSPQVIAMQCVNVTAE